MARKSPVKVTGRRCTLCAHEKAKEINSDILRGLIFRSVAEKYGVSHTSVVRHTQNCLEVELSVLIKENKVKNTIDAFSELCEQLDFAKQLREAAKDYLSDQEGKIALIPRTDEIEVLYVDTSGGAPVKNRALLSELLERAECHGIMILRPQFKHMDLRKFALDAISTADPIIDKFLKIEGLYTKERENGDVIAKAAEAIRILLDKYPETASKEALIERYSVTKGIDPQLLTQELGRVG